MSDDVLMRVRLQQVAAYRQLCAAVRSGASHTLTNAAIWLGLTALFYNARGFDELIAAYLMIGVAELAVGVWKKFRPTPEALLADGLVLVGFGLFTLGRQLLIWQKVIPNAQVNQLSVFFGAWWLYDAVRTVQAYFGLRRAFPDRPTRDQIAWFDDLVYEIRTADPAADGQAIDLPTRPRWRAKLLGTIAFFVAARGDGVVIAGPGEFEVVRERTDHGTGRRKARFRMYDQSYPEFEIGDASWDNYRAWMAEHQMPGEESV